MKYPHVFYQTDIKNSWKTADFHSQRFFSDLWTLDSFRAPPYIKRQLLALTYLSANGIEQTRIFTPKLMEMVQMSFRPLHDRVLVRRTEEDTKTAGGIIIPDTAKEKPSEGEIVAVGSGVRNEAGALVELDVKAGDKVLFGKWSGTEITLDGEELLIMKESDIMGIIGPKKATKRTKKAA